MENDFNFLVYQTAQENVSVNALVKDETIWLTQKAMAELFNVDKSSISRHLKNIFNEGELDEKVIVAKIATITQHGAIEGKRKAKKHEEFNKTQKITSDFDKAVNRMLKAGEQNE